MIMVRCWYLLIPDKGRRVQEDEEDGNAEIILPFSQH